MKGKIKFMNESKGYGFIIVDGQKEGEKDLFFHITDVLTEDTLVKEDQVEFEEGEGREGRPAAKQIKLVEA